MGNKAQSQGNNTEILSKYTFISSISQQKNLYQNNITQKQFITLERTFAVPQMLYDYEKRNRNLLEINHPYFLNQTQHSVITSSNICSMQHRVIHFFEYQHHTLQHQLIIRQKHQRHFQEKQVWSILCSCVLSMSFLTKNDIKCLTVHPRDIVIDKMGMIKIISPMLSQFANQQIVQDNFYYSPQHLRLLSSFSSTHTPTSNNSKPSSSSFPSLPSSSSQTTNKSSVFTLGITLLHILSLEPMNQLYNYENYTINIELLNQLVEKISQVELKQIIRKMIKYHTYDRITFTELEQMLYHVLEQGVDQGGQGDQRDQRQIKQMKNNSSQCYQHSQHSQHSRYCHDNNEKLMSSKQTSRLGDSVYKVNRTRMNQWQGDDDGNDENYKDNDNDKENDKQNILSTSNIHHLNLNLKKSHQSQSQNQSMLKSNKSHHHSQNLLLKSNQLLNPNNQVQNNQKNQIMNQIMNKTHPDQQDIASKTCYESGADIQKIDQQHNQRNNCNTESRYQKDQKHGVDLKASNTSNALCDISQNFNNIKPIFINNINTNINNINNINNDLSKITNKTTSRTGVNINNYNNPNNNLNNNPNHNNNSIQYYNNHNNKSSYIDQNNNTNKLLDQSFYNNNININNNNNNKSYHVRQQLSRGVYQGYKLNKMRHGYGVFYYSEGGKYAGQWNQNKMEGTGALYYANDSIAYEGEWKNDKLNGYGVLYNQIPQYSSQSFDYKSLHLIDNHWRKYEGNFFQDEKNGEGTLFLSNGQYFAGSFKDDLPHGNGIYKTVNGSLIKGNWILGMMQ